MEIITTTQENQSVENRPMCQDVVRILEDINLAPPWRPLADKCADYYDNNQLSVESLAESEAKGMPPLVVNLIKPTIDVVLGMEERTRQDWRVTVESGEDKKVDDLADALSAKIHEAEKESHADRACSESYAGQVKAGIGWVEVARETSPFKSPYRIDYIHRNEIDYDWRDRDFLLRKARYLVRRKWYDNDVLIAMFPGQANKIKGATGGWNIWDNKTKSDDTNLAQALDIERSSAMEEMEWLDMGRNRTCLFEVWYRIYEPTYVIKIKGRVVEFNEKNPVHVELYQAGLVEVTAAIVDRVRQAYWVGPHLLLDRPSPYKHNKFPYVPFFAFREDRTGTPYGLIRSMLSSQDEVNARRAKMYWLLSTRRVIADNDVVKDHKKAANAVARPDAYIILNDKRKEGSKFVVEENGTIAKDQFDVMSDAADNINRTAGIKQTLMNDRAVSGKAKEIDVEQGVTTLGEINGNYRNARIEVGELLLSLIKEDIGKQAMSVPIGDGKARKFVKLNQPAEMNGLAVLENDVQRAMSKVTLDPVPSSPTFRQQLASQLIEMTKALPPQIQGLVLDLVIEASDLPKRHEIADRIRKALNINVAGEEGEGPTPQEAQLAEQLQLVQQQSQQAIGEMQAELQKMNDALAAEKAKGFDYKRETEAIKLKEAQLRLAQMQTPDDQDEVTEAKFNMLAEQVGKLTRIVAANHPVK